MRKLSTPFRLYHLWVKVNPKNSGSFRFFEIMQKFRVRTRVSGPACKTRENPARYPCLFFVVLFYFFLLAKNLHQRILSWAVGLAKRSRKFSLKVEGGDTYFISASHGFFLAWFHSPSFRGQNSKEKKSETDRAVLYGLTGWENVKVSQILKYSNNMFF